MATPERRGGIGGISLGGIIVIVGIVVMLAWSVLLGLILVLVGLIALAASPAAGGTEQTPARRPQPHCRSAP